MTECICAMTEGSQRRCPLHGEDAHRIPDEPTIEKREVDQ